MDPRPQTAPKGGSAQRNTAKPSSPARGKSYAAPTGDVGDYLNGPQPVPYPGSRPGPVPAPHAQAPHPMAAPSGPAHAMGGRAAPQPGPIPAAQAGPAYQAPGLTAHSILSLLVSALRPDEF